MMEEKRSIQETSSLVEQPPCKKLKQSETEISAEHSNSDIESVKQGAASKEYKSQELKIESDAQLNEKVDIAIGTPGEVIPIGEPSAKSVESEATIKEGSPECEQGPVSEVDVGITEYISKHKGFSGILKQRYSDFIVNEIREDGEVVHLTSTDLPEPEPYVPQADNSNLVSDSDWEKLKDLVESKDSAASVYIELETDCEKEDRTKMHQAIKKKYPELNSNTTDKDGKKMIKVSLQNTGRDKRRDEWPQSRGDFCHFVLYKENKDTMDAINLIARLLRLKTNLFRYAGTKDRRAKTSQDITAYKVAAEKFKEVNKQLRNMMLGNFRYVQAPLTLGQLGGNRFTIVLRNITGTKEQIDLLMTSLKTVGFINYYGMQRFGTTAVPTYHVGRALLHADWAEAVDLILKPRFGENENVKDSRAIWARTKNPEKTLKAVPRNSHIERTVLTTLVRHGHKNFSSALQAIPRNTRLMYVHAYQSYVWNKIASRRLKEFGLQPMAGDLVLSKSEQKEIEKDSEELQKVTPTVLDAENVSDFTIHDIVLPLPGYDVIYPTNEAGAWYREMLKQDDLDIDNMKQKNKDYSLPGAYRKLVLLPSDVKWESYLYDDYTISLALSDMDVLNKEAEPRSLESGKFRALKLELTLPPSSYATMAVREILKMDTSASYQTTLNVT